MNELMIIRYRICWGNTYSLPSHNEIKGAENDFNAWFATLQNVLDEDTAGHLLNLIQNNTARIEILEAVLFNDITTNPFLILFDDLDGVTATGVWNAALQRIECCLLYTSRCV